MRYSESLVKEILAELEKIPVVRQVCAKMGINHSTFYRWMMKHPSFYSRATLAQYLGRKRVSDGAESVIISGVQNKEPWAARFWLTHNELRYMSLHKGKHHNDLVASRFATLEQLLSSNRPESFDKLFALYEHTEKTFGPEFAPAIMGPVIDLMSFEDPNLKDVFHAAYANWKKEKADLEKKARAAGLEPDKSVKQKP